MMKKPLLFIYSAFAVMSMSAQAPMAQWGEILHSNTNGDQASAIAIGTDNQVYWLTTMGSTEANPDIFLGDEFVCQGELYNSGNSYANNLCLLATDTDGAKKWVIYSNSGDFSSTQGGVAVDSEGNVIFTAKLRHGDNPAAPIRIIDSKGNATEFGGSVEQKNFNLLVAKASSEGELVWYKYITLSTVPGANATKDFISDAIKTSSLAVDDEGNIYVGGNFSADMTIGDVILNPTNVSNWTGDSQASSGTAYILKFDANGNYLNSVIGSDGLTQSQITNLEWADNSLYIMGSAVGETSMTFAGKEVTPSAFQSLVVGCLDSELSAKWLKCLPGEDVGGTCAIQNTGITIAGNTLWIVGMFNGTITDGNGHSVSSAAKSPREGVIVKLDASNGEWVNATTSRAATFSPAVANTGLQGYYKILQNPQKPEKCYAYGYVMNAAVGIFLREYDAETLEANVDHAWSLATQGGVPTCTAIAYDPVNNFAYITGRGNKAFTLAADPEIETLNPGNWAVLLAKYSLPDDLKQESASSGIMTIESEAEAVYYNLQGMRMNGDNLAPGIYIRHQGSETTKVLVK